MSGFPLKADIAEATLKLVLIVFAQCLCAVYSDHHRRRDAIWLDVIGDWRREPWHGPISGNRYWAMNTPLCGVSDAAGADGV
jgi:hypothetical protein